MNLANFITSDYIKTTCGINDSIDGKKVTATIIDVQRRYIEPILGTDLYNKIQSDIVASSLTGNYQTLTNEWIAPCLAWYVYMELIPEIAVRIDRGGVFRDQASNSVAASTGELNYLQQKQRDKAEFYGQRLTDYLCHNNDLFPEYTTNSDEDLRPIRDDNPFHGIDLGYGEPRTKYEKKTGYIS